MRQDAFLQRLMPSSDFPERPMLGTALLSHDFPERHIFRMLWGPQSESNIARLVTPSPDRVSKVISYLRGLLSRTQPMVGIEKLEMQFDKEFEERWADRSIPGWQEPTHKDKLFCLPSNRLFNNPSVMKSHTMGKQYKKKVEDLWGRACSAEGLYRESAPAEIRTVARSFSHLRQVPSAATGELEPISSHSSAPHMYVGGSNLVLARSCPRGAVGLLASSRASLCLRSRPLTSVVVSSHVRARASRWCDSCPCQQVSSAPAHVASVHVCLASARAFGIHSRTLSQLGRNSLRAHGLASVAILVSEGLARQGALQ